MKRALHFFILFVLSVIVGIFLINLLVHLRSDPYRYSLAQNAPYAEVVMIPGAALADKNTPAPIFTDRADTAIALYSAHKISKILVSGDNRSSSHNEVDPMRLYLLEKGIPDRDIFLDHAGLTTYDSMYRAQSIFGISSMLVSTQSFHLPRAIFIARELGINAFGVNADVGHMLWINYVREVFADVKALHDVLWRVPPAFGGPTIPIQGDGRLYP